MAIQFGMLQQIKAKSLTGGVNVAQTQKHVQQAESIFQEYQKYQTQLTEAEQNGGQTADTTGFAFGNTAMSIDELNAQIAECETKFNNLYALINEQPEGKSNTTQPNNDNKAKVQPKNPSGFMA